MKKKYLIKKQGRMFKIFETYTKQFIAQSKNKKDLMKIMRNLNKGGFFNGDTPRFMLISGPIPIDGQKNSRNI